MVTVARRRHGRRHREGLPRSGDGWESQRHPRLRGQGFDRVAVAVLEGAESCVATSSGMSAILATVMGLLSAGDHIVSSQSLFV